MSNLFARRLGAAPGVQLNPLVDESEITTDLRDQMFACMLRLRRGRIDRPFLLTPRLTGKIGGGIGLGKKTNDYKCFAALVEALGNGAAGAVIQRLVTPDAVNKYVVVKSGTSIKLTPTIHNGVVTAVGVTAGGMAYPRPTVAINKDIAGGTIGNIVVSVDKDGAITGIKVSGGSGYSNADTIVITGTGGSGATAVLSGVKVATGGSLTNAKVTVTNAGTGYPHPTISAGTPGSGAEFIATIGVASGKIFGIDVAKGGQNHRVWNDLATPSEVTITGTGGSGATAQIIDTDNGVIFSISTGAELFGDYLYGVPTISIVNNKALGGKGVGAKAVATVVDGDIATVTVTKGGSGYTNAAVIVTANLATNPQFIIRADLPDPDVEPYLFAVKDMECFNIGYMISMHCDELKDRDGNFLDNKRVTLRIIDPLKPNMYRYQFTGDLTDDGLDDFGVSTFLPDVVSRETDNIEITMGQDAVISKDSLIYGVDEEDEEQWIKSDVMKAFIEGDTAYLTADYVAARNKLIRSTLDFSYIASLDTDSVAVIKELMQVAYATNKNLRFDVQGDTYLDAIAFMDSLNVAERRENHLLHAFWTPLLVEDPTRQNGSMQMGSATLNIALSCLRNSKKDAKGFAPKHYPIMGKNWPLNKVRKNIRQLVTLGRGQLNALAKAKINPVVYEDGNYIFSDAITCANVDVSLRKLIAVTDMSSSIDDAVVRFCNGMKGYPIDIAVKQTKDYLKSLFEGAETAGWLVPSNDPEMLGKSFKQEVTVDPGHPYDTFIVNYWLRYQGTARQIFITQTYTQ